MRENVGRLAGRLMSAVVRNPVWSAMRMAFAGLLLALLSQATHASETITYTYDALGRLIATAHSGGEYEGLQTSVSYDPAGNRSNYTVTNVPAAPTLSISNATTTEGGTLVFTVTKSGAGAASASWATANGTATSGSDYTAASGTISFALGETSKTVSITTADDAFVEPGETMTVSLSNPSSGVTIGTATGTGTIGDNDVAPGFAISNATAVNEGGTLVYTVTRTGNPNGSFSVNFATANGTAVSGSDYTGNSGTLTFAHNEMSKTISVSTIDDSSVESGETVVVNLSAPTGGSTITTSQASGTINDNDVSFAIDNAPAATEGGTLVYTVTRLGVTSGSYNVNYATANGTAASGSDYTAVSSTLSFGNGETSKTISVSTIGDFLLESDETVLVNLSGPTGGSTITTGQASGTINDDDYPPPTFSITNAATVAEGGTLVFTVTKTGTTNTSYSVNFATANGTAASGSDYTATSGTLTFAANETSKTISVSTIDDFTLESAETVLVNLSGATDGAAITVSQGSGTLTDDDYPPPFFVISAAGQVPEGSPLVFQVTKVGTTNATYSVNYATADGTAIAGSDYVATSGTLTFAPGEIGKFISVPTIVDGTTEAAESLTVNLSSPTGGATIQTGQGNGSIFTPPPNNAPVANADAVSSPKCRTVIKNVTSNDTDVDGDYPLTVISVNQSWAYVASSTSVGMTTPATNGTYTIIYGIQDSRGGTASGTLTVTVSGNQQCL